VASPLLLHSTSPQSPSGAQRQYLYFCTSKTSKLSTSAPQSSGMLSLLEHLERLQVCAGVCVCLWLGGLMYAECIRYIMFAEFVNFFFLHV
jgi:hypothetical protein